MTEQQIIDRIRELKEEQLALSREHDATVGQLQQIVLNNQNRFQQINGAITELQRMKNGEQDK